MANIHCSVVTIQANISTWMWLVKATHSSHFRWRNFSLSSIHALIDLALQLKTVWIETKRFLSMFKPMTSLSSCNLTPEELGISKSHRFLVVAPIWMCPKLQEDACLIILDFLGKLGLSTMKASAVTGTFNRLDYSTT